MLAISPLQPHAKDGRGDQEEILDFTSFSVLEFPDFPTPAGCMFDTIHFDDLIHDVDVLPDLDLGPPEFMPEFSVSAGDLDEDSDAGIQVVPDFHENANGRDDGNENKKASPQLAAKEREKRKKLPSSQPNKNHNNKNNNCEGKRKTKVDWTPDLHRRFVQAVEQLGVDKAVPSRILELMGSHSLTRHNVASHLQKYRSHRKHLLAREAEAVSWSQKRQMYGIAVPPAGGGGGGKSRVNQPWQPGTMGFPPTIRPPPIQHHHPFRPLHVWGHPTRYVEHHSLMPMWPKQLVASHSPPLHPPPTWAVPPPVDPSFWHSHHQHAPNAVTPTPSCFPPTLPIARFAGGPPLAGIPPSHAAMYKSTPNHPPMGLHPTKESIDEAIGDVLTKPWLPLPIGLKPPSMDSVMVELQRQGVPNIPPPPSSSSS